MGKVTAYLLDTHALLWWLFDDPKLSETARRTIANPDHRLWVSAASAWEIAIKTRLGKLPEAGDLSIHLENYLRKARFLELAVTISTGCKRARCRGHTATPSTGCSSRSRWPPATRSLPLIQYLTSTAYRYCGEPSC